MRPLLRAQFDWRGQRLPLFPPSLIYFCSKLQAFSPPMAKVKRLVNQCAQLNHSQAPNLWETDAGTPRTQLLNLNVAHSQPTGNTPCTQALRQASRSTWESLQKGSIRDALTLLPPSSASIASKKHKVVHIKGVLCNRQWAYKSHDTSIKLNTHSLNA